MWVVMFHMNFFEQFFKGSSLENIGYEQLIPSLTVDKKAFYVTCADYVTMDLSIKNLIPNA